MTVQHSTPFLSKKKPILSYQDGIEGVGQTSNPALRPYHRAQEGHGVRMVLDATVWYPLMTVNDDIVPR